MKIKRLLLFVGALRTSIYVVVAALLYLVLAQGRAYATPIATDNANIYWSPYTWIADGSNYKQSPTVGAYLNVAFSGDTLALNIDDSFVVNPAQLSVAAFIDGSPTPIVRTLADAVTDQIVFSTSLTAGDHYARIVIRTNTDYTGRWTVAGDTPRSTLRIQSVEISNTGAILSLSGTPLAVKTPRILYYGDSITEGNGIGPGDVFGYNSVAAGVGQLLGAEYGMRGYSSSLWYFNLFSGVPDFHIPIASGTYNQGAWRNYYQGVSLLNDVNNPSSGYVEGAPDAIYNNLGINDRALYPNGIFGGEPGFAEFKLRLAEWLIESRQAVGGRPAVFMVVPFNYNCTAAINPSEDEVNNVRYKNAYVNEYNTYITNSGDTRTFLIDLGEEACQIANDEGDGLHPNATGSLEIAQLIVNQTQSRMIYEDDVQISAQMSGENITNDMELTGSPPVFTGTAPAGSVITISFTQGSSVEQCVATADEDGIWNCTFSSTLSAGEYTLDITGETSWNEAMNFGSFAVNITSGEDNSGNEGDGGTGSSPADNGIQGALAASGISVGHLFWLSLSIITIASAMLYRRFMSARY